MEWELSAMSILAVLLAVHLWLCKIHSSRIRRLGKLVDKKSSYYTRVRTQAGADCCNNYHVITICSVGLAGLTIMYLLNWVGLVDAMGWASLLVVPLPAYISIVHLNEAILPFRVECRPLRRD